MNAKSLIWGIVGTVVWLLIIFLFAVLKGYALPNSLNELGDALAGIVAPIAFFWLILGYVQQGKQLEQNSIAINQQADALKLQADALQAQLKEMKDSVDEQKKAVEIQSENLSILKQQLIPKLHLNNGSAQVYKTGLQDYDLIKFNLSLENLGKGEIYNLRITHEAFSSTLVQLRKVELDKKIPIVFDLNTNEFLGESQKVLIQIDYEDLLGQSYRETYSLNYAYTDHNLSRHLMVTTQKLKL